MDIYAIQKVEEKELYKYINEVLNKDFINKIGVNEYPILILPLEQGVTGKCREQSILGKNEIEIDIHAMTFYYQKKSVNSLKMIYLHEVAHRLTPSHQHNYVFSSIYLILLQKAGVSIDCFSLYDFQDFENSQGETLEFCLLMSRKYEDYKVDELLIENIINDYKHMELLKIERKKEDEQSIKILHDEIKSLRNKDKLRFEIAGYLFLIAVAVVGIARLAS